MRKKPNTDRVAEIMFRLTIVLSLICGSYIWGVYSFKHTLFPIPLAKRVYTDIQELIFSSDKILVTQGNNLLKSRQTVSTFAKGQPAPGLILIVGSIQGTRDTYVKVMDRKGEVIHEWHPRWNDIWGKHAGNFDKSRRPRGNSGMYLHGIDILPDASFVANFEHLSTFHVDVCGEVKWKLDNLGHHSVFFSDQGYVWVTAENFLETPEEIHFPNHQAPLRSWKLQKISLAGKILKEIEIIDVLRKNDLFGLLFLSSLSNQNTQVRGDTLHLNDVDEFPAGMDSELFEAGDLLVSLRNINTIFVFNPDTLKIKFLSTGHFVRQHDPDFMPDDRISVFDNNNRKVSKESGVQASRIIEIDARTSKSKVILDGKDRFFTEIMGVHERLPNGNILVTSSGEGRVLEYSPDGNLIWEFNNKVSGTKNGRVFTAMVLPEYMDRAFFQSAILNCKD